MTIETLFDLSHTLAEDYLRRFSYPWEALEGLQAEIRRLGQTLGPDYRQIGPEVWVHETATVAPTAHIGGPCIIGADTEVRHCAFIRGSAMIGSGCVVGNSVEVKNAILFDKVQVPHFNYVGDSILGYLAHMGAGAVTSNVRSDKCPVVIHGETEILTGRKKVGAMVGDRAEIGCNSVLNPGTVIGRDAIVYPTSCVRGVLPADHIHKSDGTVVKRK